VSIVPNIVFIVLRMYLWYSIPTASSKKMDYNLWIFFLEKSQLLSLILEFHWMLRFFQIWSMPSHQPLTNVQPERITSQISKPFILVNESVCDLIKLKPPSYLVFSLIKHCIILICLTSRNNFNQHFLSCLLGPCTLDLLHSINFVYRKHSSLFTKLSN
jgi:hypothetical protein